MYKLKPRTDIEATQLTDLKGKGYRFGVQEQSNVEELLIRQGFGRAGDNNTLDSVPRNIMNLEKLAIGRIDLMAQVAISFPIRLAEQKFAPELFEKVFKLEELTKDM